MKNIKFISKFILLIGLLAFFSCADDSSTNPDLLGIKERGDLYDVKYEGTYTPVQIKNILDNANISINAVFNYNVKVYSVSYQTINFKGEKSIASGAIYIPVTKTDLPILSFQHGTQTKRNKVASILFDSLAESMIGLISASEGYLSLIPDYIGLGKSDALHPYMMKFNAINIIDFIKAGKNFANENNIIVSNKLFLSGYSEGGYLTLATLKEIETNYSNQFAVTACAPLGGCYDLNQIAEELFNLKTYKWPYYIAYIFTTYNTYYNLNSLEKFFPKNIADKLNSFFDGTNYDYEINSMLPVELNKLFNPDFLTRYLNNQETKIKNLFAENSLLNWQPKTPLTFFHGEADLSVPFSNAKSAFNYFSNHSNATVDLISFPGLNHDDAGPISIEKSLEWFRNF